MVKSITTDATDTKHNAANLRFSMLTAQITARMPQASVNLKKFNIKIKLKRNTKPVQSRHE